tara:strand:+ start:1555 stop:2871 length:1317 start_codon:yes stop_codon:yes gene_type:complete
MDKSPAYENFMNKMAAMQGQGKPKMSATTMKIGSGMGLEKRVDNNEKKITLLKNIFKAQKQEIGEKITPKVNTLEESLISTTQILGVISQKLQLDMDQRIKDQKAAFENQRKLNLIDKRDKKEEEVEAKRKSKVASKLGKAAIKPFVGIFDQLKQLALILGTGIIGSNLIRLLKDEDFKAKLEAIYNWTTKNWKALAIAGGVIVGLDLGLKLFGAFKVLKFALGILTAPVLLKVLGIAAVTYGVFYLLKNKGKFIDNYIEKEKAKGEKILGGVDPTLNRNLDVTRVALDPGGSFVKPVEGDNAFQRFMNSIGPRETDFEAIEEARKYFRTPMLELYKQFQKENPTEGLRFFIPNLTSFLNDKALIEKEYKKLVKDKKISRVNNIDAGTLDLTQNNKIKEFKQNNLPATEINTIASMNVINPYMEQVPELFGFADLVYS